jgi:hypothetical protein
LLFIVGQWAAGLKRRIPAATAVRPIRLRYTVVAMKFGRIKPQHGRVGGLDAILDRIVKNCPYVSRIVPGRISVRRGKGSAGGLKVQYPTGAGLKCLYTATGTVQEVFLICNDTAAAQRWMVEQEIVKSP